MTPPLTVWLNPTYDESLAQFTLQHWSCEIHFSGYTQYALTASIPAMNAVAVQAREAELFAILDRMIAAMREECWKHELSRDLMSEAISQGSLSALEVFAAAIRGDSL